MIELFAVGNNRNSQYKMSEDGTEWLYELLQDIQLIQFLIPIRDDLQITRLDHFDYVRQEDLEKIGLSKPGKIYTSFIISRIAFFIVRLQVCVDY